MVEKIPGFEVLYLKYLSQLAERKAEIATHLDALSGADAAEDTRHLRQAHALLHQISGNAGSFGFSALGEAARRTDARLMVLLEQGQAPTAEHIEAIRKDHALFEDEAARAIATRP